MSERPSRRRNRDFDRRNRAAGKSISSARPAHVRSRSVVSVDESPEQLPVNRPLVSLKEHGLNLPKSTPKTSFLYISNQFTKQSISSGENSVEGISTSSGTLLNSVAHNGAQNDSERDRDIATLKTI